jgi:hypothetical protein
MSGLTGLFVLVGRAARGSCRKRLLGLQTLGGPLIFGLILLVAIAPSAQATPMTCISAGPITFTADRESYDSNLDTITLYLSGYNGHDPSLTVSGFWAYISMYGTSFYLPDPPAPDDWKTETTLSNSGVVGSAMPSSTMFMFDSQTGQVIDDWFQLIPAFRAQSGPLYGFADTWSDSDPSRYLGLSTTVNPNTGFSYNEFGVLFVSKDANWIVFGDRSGGDMGFGAGKAAITLGGVDYRFRLELDNQAPEPSASVLLIGAAVCLLGYAWQKRQKGASAPAGT